MDARASAVARVPTEPVAPVKDYFVERNGELFAGTHLLIDLWDARSLNDLAFIEDTFRRAARAADATVLSLHFHHFGDGGGVTGVAVLAESHMSIHTWPERDYAAVDIFMCGTCDPFKALPVLEESFQPDRMDVSEQRRGRIR